MKRIKLIVPSVVTVFALLTLALAAHAQQPAPQQAASRFDVISTRLGIKLFSNVGYQEMKDYRYFGTTTSDTLYLRTAGTNTVIAQYPPAGSGGFTPSTQRVYTLYARGKTGVSGRTPSLALYTNR